MLRTFRYGFRPFSCRTFLKLAAIAVISEGVMVNARFWIPDLFSFNISKFDFTTLLSPETIFFTILEAGLIILLSFIVFYVFVHLRFVFFHCVAHETKRIGPVWELYRAPAMRFFRATLLFWLTVAGLTTLVLGGFISVAITVFKLRTPEGKFDPGVFLMTFLPCMGFAFLVCLGAAIAHVVMVDFILPQMALEELTFRQAWDLCEGSNSQKWRDLLLVFHTASGASTYYRDHFCTSCLAFRPDGFWISRDVRCSVQLNPGRRDRSTSILSHCN